MVRPGAGGRRGRGRPPRRCASASASPTSCAATRSSLAQTALTLDHLSGGRFLLGVGTGEALNLTPFGLANERPLARLDEGLRVMRAADRHARAGRLRRASHFRLAGAAMGLRPLGDAPPPDLGGRPPPARPRPDRPAGRRLAAADDRPGRVRAHARGRARGRAGRGPRRGRGDARAVRPDRRGRDARRTRRRSSTGSLLMRFIALTRSAEAFAAHGAEHPLGAGEFGLTTFLPTELRARRGAARWPRRVPDAVVRDTVHPRARPTTGGRAGRALRRAPAPATCSSPT